MDNELQLAANERSVVVPDILPVYDDLVFKRLLTHSDAKDVLRFVISALINRTIMQVTIRSNETPKEDSKQKDERFDVNCRTDTGDQVAMEMQSEHMEGDSSKNYHRTVINRAVYGVCDLYASQQGSGVTYDGLLRAYQTTFLGYTIFPQRTHYERRILFKDEDGVKLSDDVGIIFIELTKINDVLKKPAKEMPRLEAWVSFMVTAGNPRHIDKLRELVKEWEELSVAYELLTTMSKNEHERALYRSRRIAQMDRNSQFEAARREGEQRGIQIGELKGRLESARGMRDFGMSLTDIAEILSLPIDVLKLEL
ncbi:MAG: Rpn family recombination-promoting nuclease/putative transposase [Oscillospiraceae bacterium]|nr:Rpn family recombination-promoting nuclease/putative transposase [Oscillospiraceae bacterium]